MISKYRARLMCTLYVLLLIPIARYSICNFIYSHYLSSIWECIAGIIQLTRYSMCGYMAVLVNYYRGYSSFRYCSLCSLLFIRVSYLGSIYIFSLITFYRSVYPRYRYDHLMQLTWLYLLPLSLLLLLLSSVCYYCSAYYHRAINGTAISVIMIVMVMWI